jgi:putative glycerol-1-phosphate prenyltransferase
MKKEIYRKVLLKREQKHKMLAVLVDPDKCKGREVISLISVLKFHTPDLIFIGGSHITSSTDSLIEMFKAEIDTDFILFPGNANQFSSKVDAMLYLSLLSGRNAEYLIGQHVSSAKAIKESKMEVIPTSYILIDGGSASSVEYMSNTRPIPRDKTSIAVSTAIAGELLGMHLTYLEAGSGAKHVVPYEMIQAIRRDVSLPLIVGGGIRSTKNMIDAFDAGADIVVVGNVFEKEPQLIIEFTELVKRYNSRIVL